MASINMVSSYINTAIARIDEALAELSSLAVLDNNTNTTQNIKTILQVMTPQSFLLAVQDP